MKIRSCSPVPTSSPRIIAFPSYIRLERRLIHSLSIGQGTFLSNPSHRPDHIEVMDDWKDDPDNGLIDWSSFSCRHPFYD